MAPQRESVSRSVKSRPVETQCPYCKLCTLTTNYHTSCELLLSLSFLFYRAGITLSVLKEQKKHMQKHLQHITAQWGGNIKQKKHFYFFVSTINHFLKKHESIYQWCQPKLEKYHTASQSFLILLCLSITRQTNLRFKHKTYLKKL